MSKVLIGKNNYLFLQNDACRELEVHNNNINLVVNNLSRYNKYINKYLLIVFPNKSYIYKQYLPDTFDLKYRPAFDIYTKFFNKHILDGYEYLKDIEDTFYKTDTHINLKGAYIIYDQFIKKINELFNLNTIMRHIEIKKVDCDNLASIKLALGDLTWEENKGILQLGDISDTYYFSDELEQFYCLYQIKNNSNIRFLKQEYSNLVDCTESLVDSNVNWQVISKYILYKNNNFDNKIKVLIFYDSFLLQILPLYYNMFNEVYLAKSIYSEQLIDIINPDYIFEFRCERFLF